jgi:AmmeMemoRadiSam system protein A
MTTGTGPDSLGASQRRFLLSLARAALTNVLQDGPLPVPDPQTLTPELTANRTCFVTLRNKGQLRGCIGNLLNPRPLFEGVIQNVTGAARRDWRFPPVTAEELPDVRIELSVLSEPKVLSFRIPEELLVMLEPGRDGLLLQVGNHTATFLPKVWEDLPDKEEFMAKLCAKAGLGPLAWRSGDAVVSSYEAEVFEEDAPAPSFVNSEIFKQPPV